MYGESAATALRALAGLDKTPCEPTVENDGVCNSAEVAEGAVSGTCGVSAYSHPISSPIDVH